MRNIAIVVVAIVVVALAIAFAMYASRDTLGVQPKYSDSASDDFSLPKAVEVDGIAAEQVLDIERQVCGGVGKEGWMPQEVVFAYLDPKETVYRIPCGVGPSGYFYRSFYFSAGGPAIIDEYHPNAQSLFDIGSPEQAAEYAMFFDIVLSGEQVNKQFVITEQDYDKLAEQCIKGNSTSPTKALRMAGPENGYTVQLNFVDNESGSFEYRHYIVARDGTIELLEEKSLGNCGSAT